MLDIRMKKILIIILGLVVILAIIMVVTGNKGSDIEVTEQEDTADSSDETSEEEPNQLVIELGDTTEEEVTQEREETVISGDGVLGSVPENVYVVTNPDDITVCINKENFLPDGWSPSDLVTIEGSHQLRSEAATAYLEMTAAAAADGIEIILVSSYRSQEYQTNLYNNYYEKDPDNAATYSAYPRTSEHELGLAVDVSYDYSLHEDLDDYPVGIWMIENAYQYGWIMSYPEDKTDITGYMYEPWHWRYVGVELATYLWENNLTLQEYYY